MTWGMSPSCSAPASSLVGQASKVCRQLSLMMSEGSREPLRRRTSFQEAGLLANLLPAPPQSRASPHFLPCPSKLGTALSPSLMHQGLFPATSSPGQLGPAMGTRPATHHASPSWGLSWESSFES